MLKRENIADVYPLTPFQEGLVYRELVDYAREGRDGPHAYFQQLVFRLRGPLDLACFERAWQLLVDRHDMLRTVFPGKFRDRPLQVVLRACGLNLLHERHEDLDSAERERVLLARCQARRLEPLPLDVAPLMRVTCLRFGAQDHAVIWDFHHILMDGWCIGVVQQELSSLYLALQSGNPPPASKALAFGRYVSWLETCRQGANPTFWKTYFQGFQSAPVLPGRRLDALPGARAPASETRHLGGGTSERLKRLAATHRSTLSDVLQAMWGVFLAKHNHSRDVLFGTVRSLRPVELPGIDDMIGPCIAMVPLRVRYQAGQSLVNLLDEMAGQRRSWLDNAACPLPDALAAAGLAHDAVGHFLVVENYPLAEAFQGDRQVFAGEVTVSDVAFWAVNDYEFFVRATPGQGAAEVQIDFEYDRRHFDPQGMTALANRFADFTARLSSLPHASLDAVALVSASERDLLVQDWGTGAVPVARGADIRGWWRALLSRCAAQPAIRTRHVELNYRQLHARAVTVAGQLCRSGLREGDTVALLANPDEHLVSVMLACLLLGVPFLPLDPQLPPDRRRHVLADSGAGWLVTSPSASRRECDLLPDSVRMVEVQVPQGDALELAAMPSCVGQSGAAYVIYTSGTTGQPKGVSVGVHSLLNYVRWMQSEFGVGPGSASALLTSAAYDLGYTALFGTVLTGGCLSVLDEQERRDPDVVRRRLVEDKLTFLKATPSYFAMLGSAQAWQHSPLPHLSLVLLGGEPQDFEQLAAFRACQPQVRLYNHYGPTEATIGCIAGALDDLVVSGRSLQRLGRPIAGARVFLCDLALKPVPAGVVGEVFLGGDILAQGYRGAAALDDTRFMTLPWLPGVRVYRTGDFAEWTEDGRVVFHGRRDDQIKVRGYRASLSDITERLRALPGVADTVVMLSGTGQDQALAAYVVPSAGVAVSAQGLRTALAQQLPPALIPSSFTPVERIPLTPNGKVDRAVLGELMLRHGAPSPAVRQAQPATPLERTVCEAFCKVLSRDQVAPDDDFFDLGGHSIKAVMLASVLRRALGGEVPILAVFDHPTPRQLAQRLGRQDQGQTQAPGASGEAALIALREGGTGQHHVVFLPTVLGTPVQFRGLGAGLAAEWRCWGLQCPGFAAPAAPVESVEALGRQFAELLLRSLPRAAGMKLTLVGWSFGAYLACETARHLGGRIEGLNEGLNLVLLDIPTRTVATEARSVPADRLALEAELHQQLGPDLSPQDRVRLQALVHHHYRLLDAYRLTQQLNCPVLAVEARDGEMRANMQGFAAWAQAGFEHRVIAGDHYSMLAEPNWATLRHLLEGHRPREAAPARGRTDLQRQAVLAA
jgi:amino acid adenylation domain-containing protein